MKGDKLPHDTAVHAGLIGASDFFELSIAVAVELFGTTWSDIIAATVGVLIEVTVMLFLVKTANKTQNCFSVSKNS